MVLDKIVTEKRKRIEERKKIVSLEEIREKAFKVENLENNFFKVLKKPGLSVIGEFKKASPSKGLILPEFNVNEIEKLYKELNVDAYSILTEEDFFMGSDENLKRVKAISDVPILRKDFIVDFYQIYEAKLLGAQGILLIVAELLDKTKEFYDECIKYNLEPLIEVHNKDELNIALESGCRIIGINNRNLKDFHTTLEITKELIDYVPRDKVVISESGMASIEDLKYVESLGCDGVLIGEMFMRNIKNQEFINEFKRFKGKSL